jgi:hypothetical protein
MPKNIVGHFSPPKTRPLGTSRDLAEICINGMLIISELTYDTVNIVVAAATELSVTTVMNYWRDLKILMYTTKRIRFLLTK